MTVLSHLVDQAEAQSVPEIIAVVAALAYLGFAIRQKIVCWIFAAISTGIYIWLFFEARLYMESMLNAFYFAMAGYGWHVWRSGRTDGHDRPVVIWPGTLHLTALTTIALLSIVSGYLLSNHSDASFPYFDSLTTWSAIWATFLVARKVLENWWYWLVIDIASVVIYWSRDLELTAILFAAYVIMIPFGLVSWTRSMQKQNGVQLQ